MPCIVEMMFDTIVVGSGPAGVHAAQTLIEKGCHVAMVDVGEAENQYHHKIPDKDFLWIRQNDQNQHRYFLGEEFEYLSMGKTTAGAHLTPPRLFITKDVEKWLPIKSDQFSPLQSLALGGLGSGWGAGCFVFSDGELEAMGLDKDVMRKAYEVIAQRIGISGVHDNAGPYTVDHLRNILPPLNIDSISKKILNRYLAKKDWFASRGFFLGRSPLAVLSQDYNSRPGTKYNDMDFWTNDDESLYHPEITLKILKTNNQFSYHNDHLALSFSEKNGKIELKTHGINSGEEKSLECRRLVLAAGALNTGRIVMRSLPKGDRSLPLISNSYVYLACLDLRAIGNVPESNKSSLSQLSLFYDDEMQNLRVSQGSLYTYRSLLVSKLVKDVPFNIKEARKIIQFLQSSLVITGIFFPENPGPEKRMQLEPDPSSSVGDRLSVSYNLTAQDRSDKKSILKRYLKSLKMLGLIPIKIIDGGPGSSIHYAGTLPLGNANNGPAVEPTGRLKGHQNVFVADSSGFRYLPGKGLTFTIMANAHRVAENAIQ